MKICLYDSGIGVIPFIYQALKNKYNASFYIYIDSKNFPYGNKNDSQLVKILSKNLKKLNRYNFDYIFITCNTISRIYLENKYLHQVNVRTILEYNLKNRESCNLLATSSLSKNYTSICLDGKDLATNIENDEIKEIIQKIKNIKDKVVLGCTHYHLIKSLLPYYQKNFLSFENEIFNNLLFDSSLQIYSRKKDLPILKKYLKIDIKIYK